MVKFKVHGGDPGKLYTAVLEDMGLCYVSKISVLGVPFYSVSMKEIDSEGRMAEDVATMEEHGYTYIPGSEVND